MGEAFPFSKIAVSTIWLSSVFLFWAHYRKIPKVERALGSFSRTTLRFTRKINIDGIYFFIENWSLYLIDAIFKAQSGAWHALKRAAYISICVFFVMLFLFSAHSYIYLDDSSPVIDALHDRLTSSEEIEKALAKLLRCEDPDIGPPDPCLTMRADLLNNAGDLEASGFNEEQLAFFNERPFTAAAHGYLVLHMYLKNQAKEYFDTDKSIAFLYISRIAASAVFYTLVTTILLFISSIVTRYLIELGISISHTFEQARMLLPIFVVLMDVFIAVAFLIMCITFIYLVADYAYYMSSPAQRMVMEAYEFLYSKEVNFSRAFREAELAASAVFPEVPSDFTGEQSEDMPIALGDRLSISSLLSPSLSDAVKLSPVHGTLYLDNGPLDSFRRILMSLATDLNHVSSGKLWLVNHFHTMRNYFILIPFTPILTHLTSYIFISLFYLLYYAVIVPVGDVCSAAIQRGPVYVYAVVLMALFGLAAYWLPLF